MSNMITKRSPSNIAIIKYWGKYGNQLPRNPSLSLTLSQAYTETSLEVLPRKMIEKDLSNVPQPAVEFYFEGVLNEAFRLKIVKFFSKILAEMPFLGDWHFVIRSYNSFPHSAGIASSASAMSALALCICEAERQLSHPTTQTWEEEAAFLQRASYMARIGSGSAARSVYPVAAVWGETASVAEASNLYAVPFAHRVHEVFHTFHDDILLISKSEKSVSSTAGHALMDGNPYAAVRYTQANQRLERLCAAMQVGDLNTFGEIAEQEALTLHALMMTSEPTYLLMQPDSLAAIRKVQAFRQETSLPLYFTLDAGPNLHLLYPHDIHPQVQTFVQNELRQHCQEGQVIHDRIGNWHLEIGT